MIPDFPHNIRIRLAQLKFFLLPPDIAKSLPCWLSQFSFSKLRQPTWQRLSNIRRQQTQISIGPILILYYEESLVSPNLNSKQHRFHGARPSHCSKLKMKGKKLSGLVFGPSFSVSNNVPNLHGFSD